MLAPGRGKRALEDHFDISYELENQIKGKHFDCGGAEGYIDATNFCFENFYKTGKAY